MLLPCFVVDVLCPNGLRCTVARLATTVEDRTGSCASCYMVVDCSTCCDARVPRAEIRVVATDAAAGVCTTPIGQNVVTCLS
jgi:hypothetical protein